MNKHSNSLAFSPAFRLLMLLAIALPLFVSGCKKDPEPPTDTGTNTSEPETSFTLRAMKDSLPLSGVFVGISPNEAQRDAGTYLYQGTTNSTGRHKFNDLLSITYYWQASYTEASGVETRKGTITLDQGDRVEREVNF